MIDSKRAQCYFKDITNVCKNINIREFAQSGGMRF